MNATGDHVINMGEDIISETPAWSSSVINGGGGGGGEAKERPRWH